MRLLFWAPVLAGLALIGAPAAQAAPIVYQLTAPNTALSPYSGPYADVTVDLTTGTTATITFSSNTVAGNTYLFGDGSSVDVNVNATSWTIGSISSSNGGTGFTPGTFSDGGSLNVDSFGVFNQTVDDFDGFSHAADTVSFVLTNTSGSWASAADVLGANSDGFWAAAHVFVCADSGSGCDQSAGALVTGFAAVPEPSTLALLLMGVTALAAHRSRRR